MNYDIKLRGAPEDDVTIELGRIEIERLLDSDPANELLLFNRIPQSETIGQQIKRQLGTKKHRNQFADVIGKWPGDESLEAILTQID